MFLAQSPGAALSKVFACNKRCRGKLGFMSKVSADLIRGAATNREFTVLSILSYLSHLFGWNPFSLSVNP